MKDNEIIEKMKLQNLDYLGVLKSKKKCQVMRFFKKSQGMKELNEGYWLYWSS